MLLFGFAIIFNFIGFGLTLFFLAIIIKEYLDSNSLDTHNLICLGSSIVVIVLSVILLNSPFAKVNFDNFLPQLFPAASPSPTPNSYNNTDNLNLPNNLPANSPKNNNTDSVVGTFTPTHTIPPEVIYSLTQKNISIIALTTPVLRDSYVSLTAKVFPNNEYAINFYYPYIIPDLGAIDDSIDNGENVEGAQSSPSPTATPKPISVIPDGLGKKTSNADGLITWEWYISNKFMPGKYPIIVSDSKNYDVVWLEIK